jgi:hypothetical protein
MATHRQPGAFDRHFGVRTSRWRGGRCACDTSRVMDRPGDIKPYLFTAAHVPWWSVVLFLIVVGLVIWFSDDFVRPAF